MSGGTLNFGLPFPDALNFGRTQSYDYDLTIAITLSPPAAYFRFYLSHLLQSTVSGRWQTPAIKRRESALTQATGQSLFPSIALHWDAGQSVPQSESLAWPAGHPVPQSESLTWSAAVSHESSTSWLWTGGQPFRWEAVLDWQMGQAQVDAAALRWTGGQPSISTPVLRWQESEKYILAQGAGWDTAQPWTLAVPLRHRQAKLPPFGWRPRPYVRPGRGRMDGALNFICPWPGRLRFGTLCFGSAHRLVSIQRSYRVINSASLIRVSDSTDIPCSSITIKLDRDSWGWTLSASLLGRAAHDLIPVCPGKVRATLNGFSWDFIVDDLRYSRAFGEFSATLAGRSPAAVMASPYATTRSYQEPLLHTAQQLALQELALDWQLDWSEELTDWTVPEGTYDYQNLTPMESIVRVVKAAGGWVWADATEAVLHAVPRWPYKPWDWANAVPVASLPSSYTLTEQRRAETGAEYDCILVSGGVNNGVCVLATRTGMPGTYPADAVVDSLITDVAPATARAIQEIADAWPMKHYSLSLPLQASPAGAGLLLPGTVFDFVDGEDGWRGLITGVTLSASRESIRQDLEIVSP